MSPRGSSKAKLARRGFLDVDDPIPGLNALEDRVRNMATDLHQLLFEIRRALLGGGAPGARKARPLAAVVYPGDAFVAAPGRRIRWGRK